MTGQLSRFQILTCCQAPKAYPDTGTGTSKDVFNLLAIRGPTRGEGKPGIEPGSSDPQSSPLPLLHRGGQDLSFNSERHVNNLIHQYNQCNVCHVSILKWQLMINSFRTASVGSFFVFRHTLTHIWDGSANFNSIPIYSGYSLLLTSPRCRLHQYTADWACLQTFKSHEILNFSQILNSPYIDILIGKRFKPLHNIASRRTQLAEANKHGKWHLCF